LCVLCAASLQPAHAWGTAGHHIIAMIAEARLSPAARDQVRHLLMDGRYTLTQISTCADAVRDDGGHHKPWPGEEMCAELAGRITTDTGPWHYIDIPVPKYEKSIAKYCPDGNCVVAAIKKFNDTLMHSTDDATRRAALLFVLHFLSDIYQPLHCAERGCDRGGNEEFVNFYLGDKKRAHENLHKVWDMDMLEKAMADAHIQTERAYADQLLASISPEKAQRWASATIDDIAWESHELAMKRVYRGIPFQKFCHHEKAGPAVDLSPKYEEAGAQVAREQLMKAGVRVAALLETALGAPKQASSAGRDSLR